MYIPTPLTCDILLLTCQLLSRYILFIMCILFNDNTYFELCDNAESIYGLCRQHSVTKAPLSLTPEPCYSSVVFYFIHFDVSFLRDFIALISHHAAVIVVIAHHAISVISVACDVMNLLLRRSASPSLMPNDVISDIHSNLCYSMMLLRKSSLRQSYDFYWFMIPQTCILGLFDEMFFLKQKFLSCFYTV